MYFGFDFIVVVSCECFEYNFFFLDIFMNMYCYVIDGGIVVFMCVIIGCLEYGIRWIDLKELFGS